MNDHFDQDSVGRKSIWSFFGYLAFGLMGILIGAAVIYGALLYAGPKAADDTEPPRPVESIQPENNEDEAPDGEQDAAHQEVDIFADVAEQALSAVVGVNKHVNITRFGSQQLEEVESGSGVIIDPSGYIVTNQHVVEGAEKITVVIPGHGSYEAELVGSDALTDLALLKIDETELVALSFGDSEGVRVGESVMAIGNPLGYFQQTVTAGIISAVERQVRVPGSDYAYTFLQTDALVNPGNSGGPLLNLKGEIIGITTAKISLVGVEGIGLVVPSNTVKRVINDLLEEGKVIRPHLGVIIDDWLRYGGGDPERGVLIVEVSPDSPAAQAGLQKDDIIVAINDQDVFYLGQLFDRLFSYYPGDRVSVNYYRNGVMAKAEIILGERPENLPAQVELEPEDNVEQDEAVEEEPDETEPSADE